jgi:phosphoadenosine phosphosulfate reductase
MVTNLDIPTLNTDFESRSPEHILRWAWETFGAGVVASSSFQTQSVALLHMIGQVCPEMPVIFLDTGFHFPETLAYRDDLQKRFNLNITIMRAQIDKSELFRQYGEGLYRRDPDLCCYINKVEPMQRALKDKQGWISGVRRDQTANRKTLQILEPQPSGLLKIHPMLNWDRRQLWTYINRHDLPAHPLLSKGYMSVGCAPCTRPVGDGEDERAGRWAGTGKTECGLHLKRETETRHVESSQ